MAMVDPFPTSRPDEQPWALLAVRLGRVARGLTGDQNEAEDLVQETVARLLTQPQGLHEGYAVTALTRQWLTRRRTLRRAVARLRRVANVRAARHEERDGVLMERVQRAVADLPPKQRAAIVLRAVAGLDYAAIAAALECDVGAVRANLHLARSRLREQLGDETGANS